MSGFVDDAIEVVAIDLGDRLVAPSLRKPARNLRRLSAVYRIVQAENPGGLAPPAWLATPFRYGVLVDELPRSRGKGISRFLVGDDAAASLLSQPGDSWIVAKRKLTTHFGCQPTCRGESQVPANGWLALILPTSAVARAERKLGRLPAGPAKSQRPCLRPGGLQHQIESRTAAIWNLATDLAGLQPDNGGNGHRF